MKRLARVVAKNNHCVVLELQQAEKCEGCPANCNKPLIDFFALRNNLLTLADNEKSYQLIDDKKILSDSNVLNQMIHLNFDTNDLMKSSALMYLGPLLLLLVFMTLGHFVGSYREFSTDLFALFGFLLGLWLIYQFSGNIKSKLLLKFRPKVTISSINGT